METLILPIATQLLAFLLVVMFFRKKRIKNSETKIYSKMLIINFIYALLAIVAYFYAKTIGNVLIIGIMQKIYLCLMILMINYIVIYNFTILRIKSGLRKILSIAIRLINLVIIFLILICPINVINEGNILDNSGLSYNIAFFSAIGYLTLITASSIAIYIQNRKSFKKSIPFIVLIILYILGIILRSYCPSVMYDNFLFTYMLFIMYFTIENPDLKVLDELIRNRELIESQIEDKSEFLFEMSLGIKKPAKNILELTKTYYKLDDQLDKNDVIRLIADNANELIFKTNNILDVSSMDASKISISKEKYDVHKLFKQIEALSKSKMEKDNVKLTFNINSNVTQTLSGDEIRLKQIIMSVIQNSISNTTVGFIDVNIDSINRYGVSRLVIKIEDSGVGMDIEKVNSILDNPSNLTQEEIKKIDKLNVSLPVAIKMIKLLDGNINIKSVPKKGTITTIVIDQKYVEDNNKEVIENLEKYSSYIFNKKRILLVDDDKEETLLIKNELAKYNVEVTSTLVGKEAIDKINSQKKYDLIIIDDELKLNNALEILKELKRNKKFNVPVIVMLEKNKEHFKDDYIESGFSDYILKNNLTEELKRIFEKEN